MMVSPPERPAPSLAAVLTFSCELQHLEAIVHSSVDFTELRSIVDPTARQHMVRAGVFYPNQQPGDLLTKQIATIAGIPAPKDRSAIPRRVRLGPRSANTDVGLHLEVVPSPVGHSRGDTRAAAAATCHPGARVNQGRLASPAARVVMLALDMSHLPSGTAQVRGLCQRIVPSVGAFIVALSISTPARLP